MSVEAKKVFYNRVRRTCLKHGIDIVYHGMPKAVMAIELVKDGEVVCSDRTENNRPLDIPWKMFHMELSELGYKGGVK